MHGYLHDSKASPYGHHQLYSEYSSEVLRMQFGSAAFDRVTDEQVLQEEMGSEYMHKVLPNTRVPVAAFTSVAKTASDSEGLTLIDPPHPTPTLIVDTDESRQED